MSTWKPSSCPCVLEFDTGDPNITSNEERFFTRFITNCKIHPSNNPTPVYTHEEQFLLQRYGRKQDLTQEQVNEVAQDVANEKQRIGNL